ncbi:hypothetical protein BDR04DRAFT_1160783 [Suillus decipiens]|nr:hypothetical protein BDR04DRAFT_1160783 [Suillus decipiens]
MSFRYPGPSAILSTVELITTPEQLIKQRQSRLALNKDRQDTKKWIQDRAGKSHRATLLRDVPAHKTEVFTDFLVRLYSIYIGLHFTYLEINPLITIVLADASIHYLDMTAKLYQTAKSIRGLKWAVVRDLTIYKSAPAVPTTGSKKGVHSIDDHRVASIQKLDALVGAALKLTVHKPPVVSE